MGDSKQVLLVINSATDDELVEIKKSILEAESHGLMINVNLVHVMPTLPSCYFNIPSMVLLAERYYEEAKRNLTNIGSLLGVQQKNQWLISGKTRAEVLKLAKKIDVNFILASSKGLNELHQSFTLQREASNTAIGSFDQLSLALSAIK